jgi:uncharacterized protein
MTSNFYLDLPGPSRYLVLPLLLALAGFAGSTYSASPAFDCGKAEGEVELLICSDDDLALLDIRLAKTYTQASKNIPEEERANFRALQRGWIKGRNDCWKAEDVRACVEFSYQSKTVELQIAGGLLEAPRYRSLRCGEGTEAVPFTASVYRNADPVSAVITRGNDQVIAFAQVDSSGRRYVAPNVSLTVAEGQATVQWFGETLQCTIE